MTHYIRCDRSVDLLNLNSLVLRVVEVVEISECEYAFS